MKDLSSWIEPRVREVTSYGLRDKAPSYLFGCTESRPSREESGSLQEVIIEFPETHRADTVVLEFLVYVLLSFFKVSRFDPVLDG